jgi:hypothetical protein
MYPTPLLYLAAFIPAAHKLPQVFSVSAAATAVAQCYHQSKHLMMVSLFYGTACA